MSRFKRWAYLCASILLSIVTPLTTLTGAASAATDLSSKGTADHIDISINANAVFNTGKETLTQKVTFTNDDIIKNATLTATQAGAAFTGKYVNKFTSSNLGTSSDSNGVQIRLKGYETDKCVKSYDSWIYGKVCTEYEYVGFPVGNKENPVKYTLTIKKDVTFKNGETVNMTFSTTFGYWDADNSCPGINKTRWSRGEFSGTNSGFDFKFGDASSSRGALQINKTIVDQDGNVIADFAGQEVKFDVYDANKKLVTNVATTISKDGRGSATVYVDYGKYYIVEQTPVASFNEYEYVETTINNTTNTTSSLVEVSAKANAVYDVVNKYNKINQISSDNGTVIIPFTKIWNDADESQYRPNEIVVSLYKYVEDLSDGILVEDATVTAKNNWKYSFDISNTALFDKSGNAYKFVVVEKPVALYTETSHTNPEVSFELEDFELVKDASAEALSGKNLVATVKNKHAVIWSKTPLTVAEQEFVKSKFDTNIEHFNFVNGDGFAEDGFVVRNGKVELSKGKNWDVYSAVYTATVTTSASITNTHTVETTNQAFSVEWQDANNQDGIRPKTVEVTLEKDGAVLDSKIVAAEDLSGSFTELIKCNNYVDGKCVANIYAINGEEIDGYTLTVDDTKLIYTHTPATVNVNINKQWKDNNNQDGLRTLETSVKFCIAGYVNNEVVYKETCADKLVGLSEKSVISFNNLPKYNQGAEIRYVVKEVDVLNGYKAVNISDEAISFNENNSAELNVINEHDPETIELNISKIWNDYNDNDGKRPGEVVVNIFADGKAINPVTINAEDNWETSVVLPKKNSGKDIVYTIEEEAVTGYTSDIAKNEKGFVITNSHDLETIELNILKTWNDDENRDGLRNSGTIVKFGINGFVNGERVYTRTIEALSSLMANGIQIKDAPKYSNKAEIVYYVEEIDVLAGYKPKYNNDGRFVIVNNYANTEVVNEHAPEITSVTVNKIWYDAPEGSKRPESITVELLANSVVVDTADLSKENNWTYTFENLNVYEKGEKIVYTVNEVEVEGYVSMITENVGGFTIINTYIPQVPNTGYFTTKLDAATANTMIVATPVAIVFGFGFVKYLKAKKQH